MNKITCFIGITFLMSSLWMMVSSTRTNEHFDRFDTLLNPEQKTIYKSILIERVNIYIAGMFLGLIIGLLYYNHYKGSDKFILCKFLTIVFTVKLVFYHFYPKQKLMLYSLTTKQQTDAWADIYTNMKSSWVNSMIMGSIGYIFLGLSC